MPKKQGKPKSGGLAGFIIKPLLILSAIGAFFVAVGAALDNVARSWPWWAGGHAGAWWIFGVGLTYLVGNQFHFLWTKRIAPSYLVWYRQWIYPWRMAAPDPRDVDQLAWITPEFDPEAEIRKAAARGEYFLGIEDPASTSPHAQPRPVVITRSHLGLHGRVVGATGAGKSALVARPIIAQHIAFGLGAMVLTFKPDKMLLAAVIEACRRAGRLADFRYVTLSPGVPSHTYNPLMSGLPGTIAERVTRAIGMVAKGPERFFVELVRQIVTIYVTAARLRGHVPTFAHLAQLLNGTRWNNLRETDTLVGPFVHYISEASDNLRYQAIGIGDPGWRFVGDVRQLTDKMAQLTVLNSRRPSLTFLEALHKSQIVYIELSSGLGVETSSQVAGMVLQDMLYTFQSTDAARTEQSPKFLALIDEFGALADDAFLTSLQQSRAFSVTFFMLHQSLSDLDRISPSYARQIAANTATRVIFRVVDDRDAKAISASSGTLMRPQPYSGVQEGMMIPGHPGNIQARDVQSAVIEPNVLLRMPVMATTGYKYSKAVIIGLDGKPHITTLRPLPRDMKAEGELLERLVDIVGHAPEEPPVPPPDEPPPPTAPPQSGQPVSPPLPLGHKPTRRGHRGGKNSRPYQAPGQSANPRKWADIDDLFGPDEPPEPTDDDAPDGSPETGAEDNDLPPVDAPAR